MDIEPRGDAAPHDPKIGASLGRTELGLLAWGDLGRREQHLPQLLDAKPIQRIAEASGAHTLLIDDFEVLSSPSSQNAIPAKTTLIDGFDRGFLQWMTLGGMKLSLKAKTMEVVYQRAESKIALLTRRLSQLNLAKSKGVSFNLASENDAVIAVSIELKVQGGGGGPRYTTTIPLKAGAEAMRVALNFSDFDHDENSPAGPATLDPSVIKSISIMDINAMTGGDLGPNKLLISALNAQ